MSSNVSSTWASVRTSHPSSHNLILTDSNLIVSFCCTVILPTVVRACDVERINKDHGSSIPKPEPPWHPAPPPTPYTSLPTSPCCTRKPNCPPCMARLSRSLLQWLHLAQKPKMCCQLSATWMMVNSFQQKRQLVAMVRVTTPMVHLVVTMVHLPQRRNSEPLCHAVLRRP